MRKIFLDELPRYKNCRYEGKIDWTKSIGYKVKFIYDDIVGEFEILQYNKSKQIVILKYNEDIKEIKTTNFLYCKIGGLLNKYTSEFKIDVGKVIKDNKRDLIITNRKKVIDNGKIERKWYQYTCNLCGWVEGWIEECSLLRGTMCSCCTGKTTVTHINSIWATDPWMIDLGVSEKDAKRYSRGSQAKITVVCPNCDKEKVSKMNEIYNKKSIGCCGRSYPEKFIIGLMSQLNIEYIAEYTPKWSSKKRYDFYIPKFDCIIEAQGAQHPGTKYYNPVNFGSKTKSPEEELKNDIYKEKLANENCIKNYITIDCSLSDMEFIKENILNSKLAELYDLSNIDWLECERFALNYNQKDIIKEVCDKWNNKKEDETTSDLAKKLGLNRNVMRDYLKKGARLNWCNYNVKEEVQKRTSKVGKLNSIPIKVFKNGVLLKRFCSLSELERMSKELFGVKLWMNNVKCVCDGIKDSYKGFTFEYDQ